MSFFISLLSGWCFCTGLSPWPLGPSQIIWPILVHAPSTALPWQTPPKHIESVTIITYHLRFRKMFRLMLFANICLKYLLHSRLSMCPPHETITNNHSNSVSSLRLLCPILTRLIQFGSTFVASPLNPTYSTFPQSNQSTVAILRWPSRQHYRILPLPPAAFQRRE